MVFNLFGSFCLGLFLLLWNTYRWTFVFLTKVWYALMSMRKSKAQSWSLSLSILTRFDYRCPNLFSLTRSHFWYLHFHFWEAAAVLLTACAFNLHFHFLLFHMLVKNKYFMQTMAKFHNLQASPHRMWGGGVIYL